MTFAKNLFASKSQCSEFLTITEVATMLRKSVSSVHKLWPQWVARYGLRPIQYGGSPKDRLLFRKVEIEAMLEQWRVQ